MLTASRFVYVMMPRTGSTRIAQILQKLTDAREVGRKHDRLANKPEIKLVFGSIRNPWAWYVSLWAWRMQGVNPISPALFKDDPVWGKYYAKDGPALFREWLYAIHDLNNAAALPWGYGDYVDRARAGFMTFLYRHLYPEGMVDRWLKLEDLAFTLRRALIDAGYQIAPGLLSDFCQIRTNKTEHLPYQEYYDLPSYELVKERERLIVDKHYS